MAKGDGSLSSFDLGRGVRITMGGKPCGEAQGMPDNGRGDLHQRSGVVRAVEVE
jgi:hypothetical protein